ncbi:MAG: RNA polymerase sigma factor [Planctomycetota bacterium]|jgi:RNA polymerase sigma-70 factor (ECF subfamily)
MDQTRSTLLVRLRDRSDQTAWRTFDDLYRPMLQGYARARGLDAASADDVAQLCIAAVLEQIGTYEHLGSFRAWLRTIVERRICDLYRKRREVQADTGVWASRPGEEEAPPELFDRIWQISHLRYCAEQVREQVAPHTYEAFAACGLEGRPAAEVAERMGLSVNQVYVAKHRVLERVRAMMIELNGHGDGEDSHESLP